MSGAVEIRWRLCMCVPGCQEAVRHALSRRRFVKGALAASFTGTAAAPDTAGAASARSFTSAVDLTHTMSSDLPTFFVVPGPETGKNIHLKNNGFNRSRCPLVEDAAPPLQDPIHCSNSSAQ